MAGTLTELDPRSTNVFGDRWMAVIFNNDHNSADEVIAILMVATKCDEEEAIMETWEADTYGKAPVHFASQKECVEICEILSTIGLKTEVVKEWQD